jgi:hypothetical protein
MKYLPKATHLRSLEEMRFETNARLSDKIAAHRAALRNPSPQERARQEKILAEAFRATKRGTDG